MRPLFSARPRRDRAPRPPRPAAGLLLRYTDPADGTVWFLLGKRARRLGGTWSNIGGSLERGEDALAGALREFDEELAVGAARLVGSTIAAVIDCGDEQVPYTLFVLDVPLCFDDADLSWENDDLVWFRADAVPTLNLHRGFARAWATLAVSA